MRVFQLFLAVLCLSISVAAKPEITKESIEVRGVKRTYYLYVPEQVSAAKPSPLVVLLHGSGGNGRGLVEAWKELASKEGIVLVGPDSLDTQRWSIPEDAPEFLQRVVEDVKTRYPINPRRVYLFGHSAGANGALTISLFESEYFAATVASAGALRPERYGLTDYAKRKIPFALFVGTEDPYYPLAVVHATRDALMARGFPVELREIPHHNHNYGARAKEINAMAWEFFLRHELSEDQRYTPYFFDNKQAASDARQFEPEAMEASATDALKIKPPAQNQGDSDSPVRPKSADEKMKEASEEKPNVKARSDAPSAAVVRDMPREVGNDEVVRVETTLVSVPVTVTDGKGKYAANLRRADFRIYEDGVEQDVKYFSPAEVLPADKPFTVALLLDTSDSTQFQLADIQQAALTFIEQLQPHDRVLVASFDRRVELLAEPTSDRATLREAIRRARMGEGGTSVYNAMEMIINQRLNSVAGPKAIVLFSDGVDTTSRGATSVTNVRAAEAVGVLVYPVQYNTIEDSKKQLRSGIKQQYPGGPVIFSTPVQGEKSRRKAFDEATIYLRTLAGNTGGRFYYADGIGDLAQAFTRIAEELRWQYILGYYPQTPVVAGQRHRLIVRVAQPSLKVRARKSYTSAAEVDPQQRPVEGKP